MQSIINTLTYQIYCYGTTGTFEKHKLLYSFLLTTQIEFDQQRLTSQQIDFFIKGNVSLDKPSMPIVDWLTLDAYHHCLYLSKHFPDKFHQLLNHIQEKPTEWKQWYEHDRPETLSFPKPFDDNLTDFEKLMLLRCFVPNRIIFAINNYITKVMGQKYMIPPTIYFDAIVDQSTAQIPIIFVLSPGSDLTNDIQKLSERKTQLRKITIEHGNNSNSMEEKKSLIILAMGQGQEKLALQALHTAQYQGAWLLLQNWHLLLSLLNEVDKEL